MSTERSPESRIIESSTLNAAPWSDTVHASDIESRRLVTDRAIIEVIRQHAPRSIVDIGCGGGWLARALASPGLTVTGLDAVPELIGRARQGGGGDFRVASFQDVTEGRVQLIADLAVCNFSLLGKSSVEGLLAALPALQGWSAILVVQTVHPLMACADGASCVSAWREETWEEASPARFHASTPWHLRTPPDWIDLLKDSGWQLTPLLEPLHPVTVRPASLILVATACATHGAR